MHRITTANGRVAHIPATIKDTADGREVTTACGQTHPEADFHVDAELDACAQCDKKVDSLLNDAPDEFATAKEATKANKASAKEAAKVVEPDTTAVFVAAQNEED